MNSRFIWTLGLLAACAMSSPAQAVTLNALSSGTYSGNGSPAHDPNSYLTGGNAYGPDWRSYFVYDLTAVTGTITAAALHLFSPSPGGFWSDSPTETLAIFDVATSIPVLTSGSGGIPAWTDLGSGLQFGSVVVSYASNGTFIDIALNAAGLAYLNGKLGGQVAFGGAITTLTPMIDPEYVFGNSITSVPSNTQLILQTSAVPISPAVWLFGSALGVMGWMRRRITA
ncbi:MAG: hypothetical protein Q8N51_16590 [Gammaproteobacteria bacterium]|nr:hypothetical protein [Gammaproteobacteria bacterium]